MKRISTLLGGAIALLMVGLAPAMAQSPTFYIGAHGGKSIATSELTADGAPGFSLDGLGSNGYIGGVHAGVDIALGRGDGLVPFAGVFGGYSWQNTQFTITDGVDSFDMTLGNSLFGGGRIGVISSGGAKYYVLAAYRQTELGFSVADLTSPNLKGWDLGLGVDIPVTRNISVGLEGIWTKYAKEEILFGGVGTDLFQQTDQIAVTARLNIAFGGALETKAAPLK